MRHFILLFISFSLALCNLVFANAHRDVIDISKTDIFERLINFVIFVALLWYLVADKLKLILHNRARIIADKLSESQSKIKEARHKKEHAQANLKEAEQKAKDIMEIAKKEALVSARQIEEKTKEQIAYLIKSNEDAMEFQMRLFQKQIIAEILEEIFSSNTLKLRSDDYINILEKRVA